MFQPPKKNQAPAQHPTRGQLGPLKQLRVYSWGYGFRGGGSFQTGMTVVERLGGDLDLHIFWKLK